MDRSARRPLALLLGAGLLLTGCSGSGGSADSTADSSPAGMAQEGTAPALDQDPGGAAMAERSTAGDTTSGLTSAGAAGGGSGGTSTFASVSVDGRAVIRTAAIGVRVEDLRAAADAAGRIARDAGGSVAAERSDARRGSSNASAELSLRVLPERFDDVLSALAALGEERSRTVSTDEVGEELIDLESRLATQRASVERVRALLAEATDLSDVVQIEAELTRRTADLESLQARLTALQDQVELSTVVVRLDTEGAPAQTEAPGFLDGLRGGWAAFVSAARAVSAAVGALLPFLPLAALAAWGVLRARRRRPATADAAATT